MTLRFVRDALRAAGYAPVTTGDPHELARLVRSERPKLVLLDLVLRDSHGLELMANVPELADGDLPVIFISGYGGDETIAKAFESVAADHIVKPFSATELTARVQAVLRRRAGPERFVLRDLVIDYETREVTVAGAKVKLTATEYELLRVFSLNAGRVLTCDALLRQVWDGDVHERGGVEAVRTYVKRLRKSLGGDAADPLYIHTERGVGYRMARPREV